MGRHYKQTHRARLVRLIREKIERGGPDLDLNRLTFWHCGYAHPASALLVHVERLGMRKLVYILIELDTAQGEADNRKQTWVTRMIETAAAARLDPKDVAALLDRKNIARRYGFPSLHAIGPFSEAAEMSVNGHLFRRVPDDAGPDRWDFLWDIHPGQFQIAHDLICRFSKSRKVTSIKPAPVGQRD